MRRLAKQDRKDNYASKRDYQQIGTSEGVRAQRAKGLLEKIEIAVKTDGGDLGIIGTGAYLRPSRSTECTLTLSSVDGTTLSRTVDLSDEWCRIGLALPTTTLSEWTACAVFEPAVKHLDVWGFTIGPVRFDEAAVERLEEFRAQANSIHLQPETLYHDYDKPNEWLHLLGKKQPDLKQVAVAEIGVKKCSYCGRLLPIDPDRPSALAFHKHNAKISGHQNECRACKKWRINDTFNPLRTTDQLHESSVITRERKLFLREPEILQTIKDREGAGLKSIVWERFGRHCFNCGVALKLEEVQLDHTRPLAYLWPIDKHATCLCPTCNNHKGDRFPIEFYSKPQLVQLSTIVGLPLSELRARKLCELELNRIVADIVHFAENWDARTFNATARKVREISPEIDLFAILKAASKKAYEHVTAELRDRPAPVV